MRTSFPRSALLTGTLAFATVVVLLVASAISSPIGAAGASPAASAASTASIALLAAPASVAGSGVATALGARTAAGAADAATGPAGAEEARPNVLCGRLWLAGGELRDAESNVLLWSEPGETPTSLACEDAADAELAAVGSTRKGKPGDGRIVLLSPDEGSDAPWLVRGEITTRGVPRRLLMARGRLAVVLEGRKGFALGIVDAKPGARVQSLVLAQAPAGLAVTPDGDSFIVAVGNDLRTFRIDDGRTRTIVPFPEPIVTVAARRGVDRILVGQGSAVVAVDPRDKADRGLLPVRARADLSGPAAQIAWLDEGRVAAVLVREPATVILLAGADLGELDRFDRAGDAIDSAGDREVRWVRGGSEKRSGILQSTIEPPPLPPYAPAPAAVAEIETEAPAADVKNVTPPATTLRKPEPAPAAPTARTEPPAGGTEPPRPPAVARTEPAPPTVEPAPTRTEPVLTKAEPPPARVEPTPAKTEPTPARVEPAPAPAPPAAKSQPHPSPPPPVSPPPQTAAPGPTPSKNDASPVPPSGSAPSPAPNVERSPAPAPAVDAKREPAPVPPPSKTDAPPGPPPAARTEPAPAKVEPVPEASPPRQEPSRPEVMPPAGTLPPATETAPPPAPLAPPPAAPAPSAARGGSITGTISGRLDLVDEIVVLGPDNLMKQFARVKVSVSGGGGVFDLGSVPPGRYVVTPMGAHGASLSARPAAARVIVTAETGARADFEILGAL